MTDTPEPSAKGLNVNALKKKVGPLPVGVWIVVFAAAGYYVFKIRSKGTATAPTVAVPTNVDASGAGTYTPAGSSAGNGGSSTSTSNASFADNNSWGSAAINYLVGLGYDGAAVNQAVSSYLGSSSLTTQQQAWVNLAIQHFGSPPQLVAAVNGTVGSVTGINSGGGTISGASNTFTNPNIPYTPPVGVTPHEAITQQGETLRQMVSRIYSNDPSVAATSANADKITGVATAIYAANSLILAPGLDTPQKGGILVTYY